MTFKKSDFLIFLLIFFVVVNFYFFFFGFDALGLQDLIPGLGIALGPRQ